MNSSIRLFPRVALAARWPLPPPRRASFDPPWGHPEGPSRNGVFNPHCFLKFDVKGETARSRLGGEGIPLT